MEITDKKLTSEDKQVFQRIANLSYQFGKIIYQIFMIIIFLIDYVIK